MCIAYSECVFVALVILYSTRMPHIVIVAYISISYFSTLSHKLQEFREKKNLDYKICFDFLCKFCLKVFSL
jgi:hypothetical protein